MSLGFPATEDPSGHLVEMPFWICFSSRVGELQSVTLLQCLPLSPHLTPKLFWTSPLTSCLFPYRRESDTSCLSPAGGVQCPRQHHQGQAGWPLGLCRLDPPTQTSACELLGLAQLLPGVGVGEEACFSLVQLQLDQGTIQAHSTGATRGAGTQGGESRTKVGPQAKTGSRTEIGLEGEQAEDEASQVAPVVKNPPARVGRHKGYRFSSWVRKIPWRRAWQPTPVFLPGESHGQRSLVGYSPWNPKKSDTTEST